MATPKIVLVEDSQRYGEELIALIVGQLKLNESEVQVVGTESEFYQALPAWKKNPPAAFVIDIMIPFTARGNPEDLVPTEIREKALAHKFYRAGVRCVNFLLRDDTLRNTPMFLHSILDMDDIASDKNYPIPTAPNVKVCPKEANGHGILAALSKLFHAA